MVRDPPASGLVANMDLDHPPVQVDVDRGAIASRFRGPTEADEAAFEATVRIRKLV
jgi:hypothetical protein